MKTGETNPLTKSTKRVKAALIAEQPHRRNPKMAQPNPNTFKTLRSVDMATLGTKPVQIESDTSPKTVHFANANGGLRVIEDNGEIRQLAEASAKRLMAAGLGIE